MGPRKGGKAFLKSARAAHARPDESDAAQEPVVDAAPAQAAAEPPPPSQQPGYSSKAAAFLKDDPKADSGSSDEDGEPGAETRGKMLQRHKREQKALKDQAKRLGKKGKDEAAKLEAELAARHAAELAALEGGQAATAAEAVAVADSLYSVHLDTEKQSKKPSKGQRRREQRAREDAEREERIRAELAELGDTDRVVEERELKAILQPLGLAIREIPPDGHCLYRSLEDQLQRLPAGAELPPAVAGEADELSFLLLRQKAAEYLRQHADAFKPFVLQEDLAAGGGGDDTFEAYCAEVEGTAAWGGQVELQALAHALCCHIVVYSVGLPVLELGEEHKDTGRTLRVCYLRHAYGLGEHYESVVPALVQLDGSDEEAAGEGEEAAADDDAE